MKDLPESGVDASTTLPQARRSLLHWVAFVVICVALPGAMIGVTYHLVAWALLSAWERELVTLPQQAALYLAATLAPDFTRLVLYSATTGALALLLISWAEKWKSRYLAILVVMLVAWIASLNSMMARSHIKSANVEAAKVERIGDRVYWCDDVTFEAMVAAVREVRAGGKSVSTLVLKNNNGGSMLAAKAALPLLQDANVPVEVSGTCASACAALWLGATQRALRRDSIVGLHGASWVISGFKVPATIEDATLLSIMAGAGMRTADASEFVDLRDTSIAWLSAERLHDVGVEFEVVPWHPDDAGACAN